MKSNSEVAHAGTLWGSLRPEREGTVGTNPGWSSACPTAGAPLAWAGRGRGAPPGWGVPIDKASLLNPEPTALAQRPPHIMVWRKGPHLGALGRSERSTGTQSCYESWGGDTGFPNGMSQFCSPRLPEWSPSSLERHLCTKGAGHREPLSIKADAPKGQAQGGPDTAARGHCLRLVQSLGSKTRRIRAAQ